MAGVNIPLQAAEHYYLITEEFDAISKSFPVLEDPANYGYFREEGGGLMVGLFEAVCAPWNVGRHPRRRSPSARSRRTGTAWAPTSRPR